MRTPPAGPIATGSARIATQGPASAGGRSGTSESGTATEMQADPDERTMTEERVVGTEESAILPKTAAAGLEEVDLVATENARGTGSAVPPRPPRSASRPPTSPTSSPSSSESDALPSGTSSPLATTM